ncbi:hypothetical protein FLP41_02775 (plasmid) [Paracoccus marcusii]|nr:hypothetical protein FLP41_02775 [Paracoccus marcusii]
MSYAQLDQRASHLARQLAAMGVGPGVPVGLFARAGWDWSSVRWRS